jgi:serine/threonine protein kinase
MACSKGPVSRWLSTPWPFLMTNSTSERTWFGQKKYFAVKIATNNYCDSKAAKELAMSVHLASGNKRHRGHHLLVTTVDHFAIQSPNGQHVCLVFEPMRDPLWLFKRRLSPGKITSLTLPLFKLYIRGILYALDYLHTDRHVIHTGTSTF